MKKIEKGAANKRAGRKSRERLPQVPSTIETYDFDDPGDETQRNFRYQHAYGVILLAACLSGRKSYIALWCEHHEDYLAQNGDGSYDAWQIKTRRPEIGAWRLNDDGLRDSIRRFVTLDKKFPGTIRQCYFVSNAEVLESKDKKKIGHSPHLLLQAVKSAQPSNGKVKLGWPFDLSFETLRGHCECTDWELLSVMRKLDFIRGPGRDSFEDEVAHTHLPNIPGCDVHPPAVLNGMRDELIQAVYKASSLEVNDPAKHWYCLNGDGATDPRLLAKRITVEVAQQLITQILPVPLRFTPQTRRHAFSVTPDSLSVLEKKFLRAGLNYYVETIQNCAHAAHAHLIELAYRKPEKVEGICDQLVGVVKKECDDARLQAQADPEPYGIKMLSEASARLREIAMKSPQMVAGETHESLLGVAGLLTAECAIWWSKEFNLEEVA